MITFGSAVDEFKLAKSISGRARKTLEKYDLVLDALQETLPLRDRTPLSEITPHHIRVYLGWLKEKNRSILTIDTYYRTLSTFFSWASEEYGVGNPMIRVDKPRLPRLLPKFLPKEAFLKMLEACDETKAPERNKAILLLLVDTGIRAGELVNLKIRDVDMEKREIKVFGKNSEERILPFSEAVARALTDYVHWWDDKDSPLFLSLATKRSLTVSGLRTMITRVARRAGIEERVYTHLLRHTFAHYWIENGGDVETLQVALGHKSIETTMIYSLSSYREVKAKHRQVSPAKKLVGTEGNSRPGDR